MSSNLDGPVLNVGIDDKNTDMGRLCGGHFLISQPDDVWPIRPRFMFMYITVLCNSVSSNNLKQVTT